MSNIFFVVIGLLVLIFAGYLNEDGGSPIGSLPLALLGLGAILKGLTPSGHKTTSQTPAEPTPRIAHPVDEMPLAEEIADAPTGQKIPAKFKKPTPAAAPPLRSTCGGGTVALSSAKYLNGGKTDFRKGHVNETTE